MKENIEALFDEVSSQLTYVNKNFDDLREISKKAKEIFTEYKSKVDLFSKKNTYETQGLCKLFQDSAEKMILAYEDQEHFINELIPQLKEISETRVKKKIESDNIYDSAQQDMQNNIMESMTKFHSALNISNQMQDLHQKKQANEVSNWKAKREMKDLYKKFVSSIETVATTKSKVIIFQENYCRVGQNYMNKCMQDENQAFEHITCLLGCALSSMEQCFNNLKHVQFSSPSFDLEEAKKNSPLSKLKFRDFKCPTFVPHQFSNLLVGKIQSKYLPFSFFPKIYPFALIQLEKDIADVNLMRGSKIFLLEDPTTSKRDFLIAARNNVCFHIPKDCFTILSLGLPANSKQRLSYDSY